MSPDDIDSLIVDLAQWIEDMDLTGMLNMDDDTQYESLSILVNEHLEKFCTRDRNYN